MVSSSKGEVMKRMMMGALALATLLGATAAQAADMPRRSHTVAPVPFVNWTGFYVGAGGGYGFAKDDRQDFDAVFNMVSVNAQPKGGFINLKAGYNWRVDNFVFGPQAVFALSNMKSTGNGSALAWGFIPTGATFTKSIDEFYQLQMRLGYLVTPNVLAYVKGGYMGGSGTVSGNVNIFSSPYTQFTAKNSFSGSTFGVGLEIAMRDNWALQFDYDYMNGGTSNVSFQNPFGGTSTLAVNNKFQTVSGTLIKRF